MSFTLGGSCASTGKPESTSTAARRKVRFKNFIGILFLAFRGGQQHFDVHRPDTISPFVDAIRPSHDLRKLLRAASDAPRFRVCGFYVNSMAISQLETWPKACVILGERARSI